MTNYSSVLITISGGKINYDRGLHRFTFSGYGWVALLILLLQTCICCPAVYSGGPDAQETMYDSVAAMERTLGIVANAGAPMTRRLAAIEQRVFGQQRSGSLDERLHQVKQTLASSGMPAAGAGTVTKDALPLLNAVPPNFLRIEPPGYVINDGEDYFNEIMDSSHNRIIRFKQMPVPVFVNQFPDRQFTTAVIKGFETWEDLTGGAVRFVQVGDASKARIQVAWKRLGQQEDKSGCALGAHTITKFTPKGKGNVAVIGVGGVPVPIYVPKLGPKYNVPPQIIEINLDLIASKTPAVRYRLLQNVVTHELGHALGLLGHSKCPTDMMYPVTDEHSRLSERDINTLTRIYKSKIDVPL